MRVVSVIGISGSGKTTTVEQLLRNLKKRRYSVGSVKDIHFEAFAIDTPGTNTYRHRQAGAELVTARGLRETDFLFPVRLPMDKILSFYDQEWVVLEGVEDINAPKIVCGHDLEGVDALMGPDTLAVAGRVANTGIKEYKGVAVFNSLTQGEELTDYVEEKVGELLPDFSADCCALCGMSCREFLAAVLRGEKKWDECPLEQEVELKIGGRDITMVPFVQEVLARTLVALVSTLDGYRPGADITLNIKRPGRRA